jgi:hypothetical protein
VGSWERRIMQTRLQERPLTLLDVIATVSGLTVDEEEAAVVINHMLNSERIAFANRSRREELERWLS